jgi:holo-[acyl-carrier protein] synthase
VEDGVVAGAIELVAIAEVRPLLDGSDALAGSPFSAEELAYARARRDPERRLAARLAAKRAAARLLGEGFSARDAEVQRGRYGPPRMRLSERAARRLGELGAGRMLVSLTHGREHAAAAVLLLR